MQRPAPPPNNGRSHRLLIDSRQASELATRRKWGEAEAAFLALADDERSTDLQRSVALQRAAAAAGSQDDHDRARELIARIPLEAVAKTASMQLLSSQRKWMELVSQFGEEDLTEWPFWQIGEAAWMRGRAFHFMDHGERAAADLELSLAYTPDPRNQVAIRTLMADNRASHLDDADGALALYLENLDGKERIGGADEFRSLSRAAAILSGRGDHDRALGLFAVVDFSTLRGVWLHEMRLARADALAAAGQGKEAAKLRRQVLEDPQASAAHRERARQGLETP